MKTFTLDLWKRHFSHFMVLLAFIGFSGTKSFAQPAVTLNPSTTQNINEGGTVNFTATRNSNMTFWTGGNSSFTYTWSATGPASVGFTNNPAVTGDNNSSTVATFTTAGVYTVTCFVQEGAGGLNATSPGTTVNVVVIPAPNLWATSTNGSQISGFTVANGSYTSGPNNLFVPSGGTTAALGKNPTGGPGGDFFYWLPNSSGNNGIISIYASNAAGGAQNNINNTFDVNTGADNSSLGFVRLAMDVAKTGWVLAGNGTNVFMAKFASNGTGSVSPVSVPVSLSGGVASTFQNGDVCIDGNNTMYALANNGGLTQIFVGSLSNPSVTLTQKWNLVAPGGGNFSGSVNGVAFDVQGSLYISTSTGLYFIDQTTVNTQGSGTVVCSLVHLVDGLQDLASNAFPTQTQLPVDLISFSGTLKNDITILNWETENELNFDRFDIERRDGSAGGYTIIGTKVSQGGNGHYTFSDNLSTNSGKAFNYRLKAIDIDGKFKYSNVILIRKDQKSVTGITMNPNPVVGGMATVRFSALLNGNAVFNVLDLTGKVVLTQQTRVYEGTNSVSINNLDRLQPGSYLLQMIDGENTLVTKFSVNR